MPPQEAPSFILGAKPNKQRRSIRSFIRNGGPAVLAAVTLAACGSSNSKTPDGRLYVETADNHRGTDLFSSPKGGAVPNGVPGEIQYGTEVLVKCFAPNESGMSSINDFYLIMGGVNGRLKGIRGTYAPANTFANGGPMGNNPYTIDQRVPQCAR